MAEAVPYISESYIFDLTIDEVNEKQSHNTSYAFVMTGLIHWIAVSGSNFLLGTWRRINDQKTYSFIFAKIAAQVSEAQFRGNMETARIVTRTSMARHLVDFFESSVPELIEQIIAVAGALLALSLLDWRTTAACRFMIIPNLFVNRHYSRKIAAEQTLLNDDQENEVLTFLDRNAAKAHEYCQGLGRREVRISTLSAYNYSLLKLPTIVIFVSILHIALDLDAFSVGQIYAVVAYIWAFIGASEYIPSLSEKWITLRDVSRRLTLSADG